MELVHRLRERRADQQTIRAALEAVAPNLVALSDLMEGPPAEPTANDHPIPPITGNTCPEPAEHGFLGGKNMRKRQMPRSLRQRGPLYKRGKPPNQMWYGRYRRSVLTKNGTVRLQTKNDRRS